jgi:hypothetical protein
MELPSSTTMNSLDNFVSLVMIPRGQITLMSKQLHVARDVCLDILGISMPATASVPQQPENRRETGETRTHYRMGPSLLLADLIAAAGANFNNKDSLPCLPEQRWSKRAKSPLGP